MENLATQQKVQEIYLKYVTKGELVRVDGEQARTAVAKEVLKNVTDFLERSSLVVAFELQYLSF